MDRSRGRNGFIVLLCVLCLCANACNGAGSKDTFDFKRGLNDYAFTKASFSATDREGRVIDAKSRKMTDHDRYVGVFYFLWMGTHVSSAGVYNVTELEKTEEGRKAVFDPTLGLDSYLSNGLQSPTYYVHYSNEPLYGYYNSADPWVIARHIELLTMADIDFLFLDVTNNQNYSTNIHPSPNAAKVGSPTYAVLNTLLEYSDQGWDVPKVVFYTNESSGDAVDDIYDSYYRSGQYEDLWFKPFGKPMIVGVTEKNNGASNQGGANLVYVSQSMQAYFDVRESQWPNQPSKPWGFPWMDWTQGENYYFEENKAVNVSVAQHGRGETSYSSGDICTSRGYDEETQTVDENWAAGKNIQDQWDTVFKYDGNGKEVEMVTVSCWNEWLAWKYVYPDSGKVAYIDNFDAEHSRDIEPDKEYYKDNFYMQLVRNVRNYKYGNSNGNYTWETGAARSTSDFGKVKAVYKDMQGDARARDFYGFDIRVGSKENNLLGAWYTDKSNRNDIAETRVIHDEKNLYLQIATVDPVTAYGGGENWMNVLIKTRKSTADASWEGYDYLINRMPGSDKTSVEKSCGGWNWTSSGEAQLKIDGRKMILTIPLAALGMQKDDVCFEFKVADNVTAYTDMMDYYVTGDSAPIGRLNYAYGY